MKRQFKLLVATALTLSMTSLSAVPAGACDGRGGGRSFRRHVPFATSHRAYQHNYRQPVYHAPPAPVYTQPQPRYAQPQPGVQTQAPAIAGQRPQQAPVQQVRGQQAPVQQAPVQQARGQQAPVQQARGQQAPAQQTAVAQGNAQQAAPAQQTTQPAGSEATALQLLESMADNTTTADTTSQIPQFTAAASTAAGNHVGTWKVNLPGNQSVELSLNQNGTFNWTATKNGKSSAFEGQYKLETGRLTLVRSTDLQQMAGNWTASGDNFTFKLDGTTTGGLAFARS